MASPHRIAIVGAGIIGVSTAAYLRDLLPAGSDISIFAKELSPETTGDSAAGLWEPVYFSQTPEDLLWSWSKRTWDFLVSFLRGTEHPEMGVYYQAAYQLSHNPTIEKPFWADIVASFNMLDPDDVQRLVPTARSGFMFTTLFAEGEKIIQYFYKRLMAQGVRFFKRKITSFDELVDEGYDLIINCSGIGSKELVPDDGVYPIRGQIHMVEAPWIRMAFVMETGYYILPNTGKVILGGTNQVGDWSEEVRAEDKRRILESCAKMMPACAKARIIREWTGLRPGRKSVRIDHESRQKSDGKRYDVVHNYGHGGSGLTIFWGCAEDACNIAVELLKSKKPKL